MSTDPNIFKGYYDRLDEALDIVDFKNLWGLVFCRRINTHTATIVLKNNTEEDRLAIDQLAGIEIPKHLYETPNGGRVGVIGLDLADKDQDYIRLYTRYRTEEEQNSNSEFLYGTGYCLDKKGKVISKKLYNANTNTGELNIGYFDEANSAIGNDKELMTMDYETWGGPRELYDAVVKEELGFNISAKEKKDQGYFLVVLNPPAKFL